MKISIIIPTLNRATPLKIALESIVNQSHLSDVEIIVVDNGSTDQTKEVVNNFSSLLTTLKYEFEGAPGLLAGRHKGATMASGEILCFLDDDVSLHPSYLAELASVFSDPNVHLATGPCKAHFEVPPPDWLPYLWSEVVHGKHCGWLSLIDFGNETIEIHPNFVWGLNFCIRKQALIDLGGFHPDNIPAHLQKYQGNGETGLTIKASQKGFKAIYHPGLALTHFVPKQRLTLAYFKARSFIQGICESFTHLRETHLKDTAKKSFRDRLHPYYRWIKLLFPKQTELPVQIEKKPKDIEDIIKDLDEAQLAGYTFHQNHFKNDPKVREWVLKENYWNYSLPNND